MKKTIGILAHVDAGKTTFAEQVLYHTNAIRSRGRVDHKDSFLDNNFIERERGITIFSEGAAFKYAGNDYYLIDTPGHVDFSTEMERAIAVMDYGIIIISAVEGVQSHTETLWNLLRKNNVPVIFFINKLDREAGDKNKVLKDLKKKLGENIFYIENSLSKEELQEDLIEGISELDEELLEKYLEGEYNKELWLEKMRGFIKEGKLFTAFGGSALLDEGIEEFLENLNTITYTNYKKEEKFSGRVFKVRYDENGNRLTFIKALSGVLRVKDELEVEENLKEKINAIRIYNGNKYKAVEDVSAGDVFAVLGLTSKVSGDAVGELKNRIKYDIVPTMTSKVIFDSSLNVKEVLEKFKILEGEDPALNVFWNEALKEIHISIMGKIQLEVLKSILEERFKLKIEFGPCKILYKESILDSAIGSGHFEPLRHYAEVHLKLEALPRNTGILFENKCPSELLSTGQQNLIKSHIFEREHHGLLTGSPITDIKFTLLAGKAHLKHTCGGDFREATYRAIRQGLEKCQKILLEPYYKFKIRIPLDYIGRVISDVERLSGKFNPPEINEDSALIEGRGPVKTFMEYSMELAAFTGGRGNIALVFDGYDLCHNEEEVIHDIGYEKERDIEYTSSSVFCSKGEGYIVKWQEADEKMHIDLQEIL